MSKKEGFQAFVDRLMEIHLAEAQALEKEDYGVDYSAHFAAQLEKGLEDLDLQTVLKGIEEYEQKIECGPFNTPLHCQLISIVTRQGNILAARDVADRLAIESAQERISGLMEIAYVTKAADDIEFAKKELAKLDPVLQVEFLLHHGSIDEDRQTYVQRARAMLRASFLDTVDKAGFQRLTVIWMRFARFTKIDADCLEIARCLNDPRLDPSDDFMLIVACELYCLRNPKLALRLVGKIRDCDFRTKMQRSINNERPDVH
jgi:hypothetical protein